MSDPQTPFPAATDSIATEHVIVQLDDIRYSIDLPQTQLKPLVEALNDGHRISFRIGHRVVSFDFGNCRLSSLNLDLGPEP